MDPEQHRVDSRERWEAAAEGWERRSDAFARGTLPVAHWLVEAIHPQPGQVVLELAAGPGDVGFLAAELLEPGGRLICTDFAEAMVAVAERRARERGVVNAEFRPMELEWVDQRAASVDAILCRFGYMHAVDPEAALRDARRVLKPGGRLALAVWDAPEHNPWLAVVQDEIAKITGEPARPEGEPGAFALSAPGAVLDLLHAAAFDDVELETIELVFAAESLDAWWDTVTDLSTSLRTTLKALAPADVYRLRDAVDERWSAHIAPDGTLALPARALCAAAGA